MSSCAPRRRHPFAIRLHCVEGKTVKILITFFYTRTDTPTTANSSHIYLRSFMIFWLIVCRVACGFIAHRHSLSMLVARVRARNSKWASFTRHQVKRWNQTMAIISSTSSPSNFSLTKFAPSDDKKKKTEHEHKTPHRHNHPQGNVLNAISHKFISYET